MFRKVEAYREWPDAAEIVGEDAIKFTLTYQGDLPACTQSKTRTPEKHAIRAKLHPQLLTLFQSNPLLAKWKERDHTYGAMMLKGAVKNDYDKKVLHPIVNVRGTPGNLWFQPLITKHNGLGCELNIKFMRPGNSRQVYTGGDLDNRLKTLFDGLRMPNDPQEIPQGGWLPSGGAFHCLLEDDCLIVGLSISTEPLLTAQTDSQAEVRLEIGVRVVVLSQNEHNQVYRAD
jgi:hypothetical protein